MHMRTRVHDRTRPRKQKSHDTVRRSGLCEVRQVDEKPGDDEEERRRNQGLPGQEGVGDRDDKNKYGGPKRAP